MVSETPYQEDMGSPVSFRLGEYNITEISKFDIKAKALSKKNYRIGTVAGLLPTDLALGWGNISDERVLEKIKISQSR